MTLLFFDFGTGEILLIMLVLFVVLGPKKLPEVARAVGKTINEMKRASAGFKNEINKEIERIERDTTIKDVNLDTDQSVQADPKPLHWTIPLLREAFQNPIKQKIKTNQ